MNFGIVYDKKDPGYRVPLTPGAVVALVHAGHKVYVLSGAGQWAKFSDEDYKDRGAHVVYSVEEAYGRPDVVLSIRPPKFELLKLIRPGVALVSFLHLTVAQERYLDRILDEQITAIGLEVLEDERGDQPVLSTMSEIAGQQSVFVAGRLLQTNHGGRGILFGDVPGIMPARVLILGAGSVGLSAAITATGVGADVLLLDQDINKLRRAEQTLGHRIRTGYYSRHRMSEWVRFTDVVIGAARVPGERAPILVTEEMVRSMREQSVIIDLAIDMGGCVATSRPTTLASPTYVQHGIIHYCVPNITDCVARSASYALSHILDDFLGLVGDMGQEFATKVPAIRRGTYTYKGHIVSEKLAAAFGRSSTPIDELEKE